MMAVLIIGVLFLSLYSGISYGFSMVNLARESLRATQVMVEKSETIRLYNWDQINNPGFIPTNFYAYYYPTNAGFTKTSTFKYDGAVTIEDAGLTESYSNEVKRVSIQVTWESSGVTRTRGMVTFISRNGLQNYLY
jgi:hypothetical protein